MSKNLVGKTITIKPGTRVSRDGATTTRKVATKVTVLRTETAKGGKTRVYWKSNGLRASATI